MYETLMPTLLLSIIFIMNIESRSGVLSQKYFYNNFFCAFLEFARAGKVYIQMHHVTLISALNPMWIPLLFHSL